VNDRRPVSETVCGRGEGAERDGGGHFPAVRPAAYDCVMVIKLDDQIERELRRIAGHQGRALADVVEAALRTYIETEAITDIESADLAAAQLALVPELPEIEGALEGGRSPEADAQG